MAKFQQIEKVRTAVDGVYKKALYHRSLSTQGFMALQPYFIRELFPKEKINGKAQVWSRLNTIVLPTFGDCDYHLSKFFVRYKDIWPCWDDFYNRSLHSFGDGTFGYVSYRPNFRMHDFYEILLDIEAIEFVPNPASGAPDPVYDFVFHTQGGDRLYKWTESGLPVFSLLTQCGYELSWNDLDDRRYDMLPLFALAKIYIDHYFPKRYRNTNIYKLIAAMFSYNGPDVALDNNSIYSAGISTFFTYCTHVFYDNDGLYCAWDNPVGPESKELSPISIKDNTNTSNHPMRVQAKSSVSVPDASPNDPDYTPIDNTPFIAGAYQGAGAATNYAAGAITKNLLDMLYRVSNMVKRYQLAGNSAAARFLARFGFELGDTHESYKLGTHIIPVRVGDVESNSDSQVTIGDQTFTSLLGNLAGKGVAADGFPITYNGDSHAGLYFCLLSIIPDAGLYQGLDRRLLNVDIEDTITPDNDALGVRAISVAEVYTSYNGNYNNSKKDDVYGFLPFGWEHCVGRNILSGAFRLVSQGKEQLAPYHLYRDLGYSNAVQTDPHVGLNFLSGLDAYQFNRMFYNLLASQQFIIRFRMKYDSTSFKKPLYDSYDWNMDSDNKQVVLDANSIDMN